MALGGVLGPVLVAGDSAALCVAGVALGDIHVRFTWQAWHNLTSTFVLRGRRGTIFLRTPLCHTPSFAHTILHTPLCHTPSFTTPSFTHNFVAHHLSPHHLSHTTLSHTIFRHTIFHTPLCHIQSFAHNFVTRSLSHRTFTHTIFHTLLCHTLDKNGSMNRSVRNRIL